MKNEIEKKCANCVHAVKTTLDKDVLCRKNGIVSKQFCCPNFRYYQYDEINKKLKYHCKDCNHFIEYYHPDIISYGVCHLFSVRFCDGSTRKACSKFVKKEAQTSDCMDSSYQQTNISNNHDLCV